MQGMYWKRIVLNKHMAVVTSSVLVIKSSGTYYRLINKLYPPLD